MDKNTDLMIKRLEKEINGFILGGLSGGFQFDEEQAQYLQELQDTMLYIFEKQENMIDQQTQAFEFMWHTAKTRKEQIKKLKEEAQKLRKENLWGDELIEQANEKDEQIKMFKRDIEKVMEIYADV